MSGFDKIEFAKDTKAPMPKARATQKSSAPQDFAKSKNTDTTMTKRKTIGKFRIPRKVYISLIVVVLLIVLISIPAYATYKSALKTYRQSKLVTSALKKQNVEIASKEIITTQKDLQ